MSNVHGAEELPQLQQAASKHAAPAAAQALFMLFL
jgi:hypothetical protein